MRCRGTRRMLLAALDGEITVAEREALDAHLSGCETCRAAAGETARLHHALRALPGAVAVPAGLEQATLRRVRAVLVDEDAAPGVGFGTRWSGWWMATPLAAALAGVIIWRVLPGGDAPGPSEVAALRPVPTSERVAAALPPAEPVAPAARVAAPAAPSAQGDVAAPPPQVAEALDLFLEMPILENMEKLQNFDSIRTVDGGEDGPAKGGRG